MFDKMKGVLNAYKWPVEFPNLVYTNDVIKDLREMDKDMSNHVAIALITLVDIVVQGLYIEGDTYLGKLPENLKLYLKSLQDCVSKPNFIEADRIHILVMIHWLVVTASARELMLDKGNDTTVYSRISSYIAAKYPDYIYVFDSRQHAAVDIIETKHK